jgi:hypothetical protein
MELPRFADRGTFLALYLTTFSIVSEYRPCSIEGTHHARTGCYLYGVLASY